MFCLGASVGDLSREQSRSSSRLSIPSHSFKLTSRILSPIPTTQNRKTTLFGLMFVRKLGGRAAMAAAAKSEVSFSFF